MFAVRQKKRTANYWFAVRQNKNARQTIFLPGVFYYRAPWKIARQSSSLPCARKYAHGKDRNARQSSFFP
jgi:hypothetical protein